MEEKEKNTSNFKAVQNPNTYSSSYDANTSKNKTKSNFGKGFLLPSGNHFCYSYRWGISDSGFVLHGIYAVEGHEREV